MRNHFDRNIGVRDLILQRRPKYVVELGAGSGDNTRQILSLKEIYDFNMITISTGGCPSDIKADGFKWVDGVSFMELNNIPDDIEFCSIDTDHNYWTLKKELDILYWKMGRNATIAIHDTESYAKSDGVQFSYDNHTDIPYPVVLVPGKPGLQTAIFEFLLTSDFRLYRHTEQSCGATILLRGDI